MFHGKGHAPELSGSESSNVDSVSDTNVSPVATLPRRTSAAFWIWTIFLGIVLLTLTALALYWHFQAPVPRSPDQTQTHTQPGPVRKGYGKLADTLLPLRTRHPPTK